MDGHFDKVWSLDVAPNGKHLISGGADSQIVVWKDTTVQEERSRRAEEERNILKEQQLANHLRHKEFEQALEIALDLEKPNQALKVRAQKKRNETTGNVSFVCSRGTPTHSVLLFLFRLWLR